ncbi:MAG: D-tyrosyl-tRNA(Tyr) deacylase [bacterium]|nr:MAG: D-tyrosyl-tRNA(Tyr) deacylase [bacterium]
MRALVQRVRWSEVRVGDSRISGIGPGLLVFLGVGLTDTAKESVHLAGKVASLRIFEDTEGKMNLSVRDAGGEVLVVPQFTLLADTSRGNRPGFGKAAPPDQAQRLYERFIGDLEATGVPVRSGVFRAEMLVSLANDGPVTILLESP